MKNVNSDKNQRDLFVIMKFSTALGLGVMCAFLFSLKDVSRDASLEFSVGTVVAFVIGAATGWGFWAAVIHRAEKKALIEVDDGAECINDVLHQADDSSHHDHSDHDSIDPSEG